MPKRLIKRIIPDHDRVRGHRHLRLFGELLHDPNLWHLNRRSASGAFAVGLFAAFIPLPFQMVFAAAGAILFRVNLALSVVLVWITNPLTIPPIFYCSYLVGAWLLGDTGVSAQTVDFTLPSLLHGLGEIWRPLLLGSLVCGTLSAALGYSLVLGFWRLRLVRQLRKRRKAKLLRRQMRLPEVSQSEQSTPS